MLNGKGFVLDVNNYNCFIYFRTRFPFLRVSSLVVVYVKSCDENLLRSYVLVYVANYKCVIKYFI